MNQLPYQSKPGTCLVPYLNVKCMNFELLWKKTWHVNYLEACSEIRPNKECNETDATENAIIVL